MTQVDRVLALLRERGDRGLNTVDFVRTPTADGGAPILRLAARIRDLQDRGYRISSQRKPNHTATYRLLSEPGVVRDSGKSGRASSTPLSVPAQSPAVSQSLLFDPDSIVRRGSYRDVEAA